VLRSKITRCPSSAQHRSIYSQVCFRPASMMGLTARILDIEQSARVSADHANHFSSSVTISSITLLSTRICIIPSSWPESHSCAKPQLPFPSCRQSDISPGLRRSRLSEGIPCCRRRKIQPQCSPEIPFVHAHSNEWWPDLLM